MSNLRARFRQGNFRGASFYDPHAKPVEVPEFCRTALIDLGRTMVYSGSGAIEIAYAHSGSSAADLVCATAGGTGRIANVASKMVEGATGAIGWAADIDDLGAGRCVYSNGYSDIAVFAGDDENNTFANFRSVWKDSDTPPALASNTPTTTATAAGTSHAVDIPALSAGDMLLVLCTASANATMTLPAGNWSQRYSEAVASTRRALCFVLLGATGMEGSTVTFTSSVSVDASWAVYHFPAGQWDSAGTPTAASVVALGTAANGTNTAPNPGSISPFEKNGAYALVAVVHVSDVETFSADPTGFTDGTTIQSTTTTTRSAVKFGPGENPPAFTKSGAAGYRTRVVAVRTGVGTGLAAGTFMGLAKYSSDGVMQWWTEYRFGSTSYKQVTCTPDGSTVFVWTLSGLTRDGTGASIASTNGWIELDGATGAVVNSWNHDPIRRGRSAAHVALFGATKDRILVIDRGSNSSDISCLDARDIGGAPLWQLDKQTDFASGPWTSSLLVGRRNSGVIIATTSNNLLWFRIVSDDGVIEKEVDVATHAHGLGSNPGIESICEDKFGHIYVLCRSDAGSDIVRYDAQGEFVWSAAGTFGLAQAAHSAQAFANGVPLLSFLPLNIAVGAQGHIFVTERNAPPGVTFDGHVLRLKMECA